MNSQFDAEYERRESGCLKWDASSFPQSVMHCESRDIIPMWIADMDFRSPEFITDALTERLSHPIFGYQYTPENYYSQIAQWHKNRYGQEGISRDTVSYQNSVLGGVASALTAFSQAGDWILIHQPTYIGFQVTIQNLGRNLALSPLVPDENGVFRMDLADMEEKIKSKKIPVFVFCSPHNPTGRVWEAEELSAMLDLCHKYGVKVISDEIWADFILDPSKKHLPTSSFSQMSREMCISFYAPSKTFNLAGLVGAYSLCFNQAMHNQVQKVAMGTHYNLPNTLSTEACMAAYTHGGPWVDEMRAYLRQNASTMAESLNAIPGFSAYVPEATYLMWVNVKESGFTIDELVAKFKSVGVLPNVGRDFYGEDYFRFNIACPYARIQEACKRITSVMLEK